MKNKTRLDLSGPLRVERLPDGRHSRLLWPYKVQLKNGECITAPAGFETDFASTPRFLWSIVPPFGKYERAAVIHDFLCRLKGYKRSRADRVFLELMKALGVPLWKRQPMYLAVRVAGIVSPSKQDISPEEVSEKRKLKYMLRKHESL